MGNKKKSKDHSNTDRQSKVQAPKKIQHDAQLQSHASGMHADSESNINESIIAHSRDNNSWHDEVISQTESKPEESGQADDDRFNQTKKENMYKIDHWNSVSHTSRHSDPCKRSNQNEGARPDLKRRSLNDNGSSKRSPLESFSSGRNRNSSRFHQKDSKDPEFITYDREFQCHYGKFDYIKTEEITKDLFEMSEEYSLAHCVAEDMNMGSGIAVPFRQKFKRVDELLNQRQTTGGLAVLKISHRYIYYLVTKKYSYGKPTYATLFSSLKCLRNDVIENRVTKLAMPRIGCGLDRLEWNNVRFMIEFVFRDVDIEIVVCNLEPNEDSPQQKHKNCRVTHELYPIQNIDIGTIILYFSSEDEYISEEMRQLDEKFHFLIEFRSARKSKGNVILYTKNQNYLLCGCIVKRRQTDPYDFTALQKCLLPIQKENRKLNFSYYAFQAIRDDRDPCINYKIINVLRNSLHSVEVYVCWPGDLQNDMAPKDRPAESRESLQSSEDSWRSKPDSFYRNKSAERKNRPQDADRGQPSDSFGSPSSSDYVEDNNSSFQSEEFQENSPQPETRPSNQGHHPLDNSWEGNNSAQWSNQIETVVQDISFPNSVNHELESFQLDFKSGSSDYSMMKEQKDLTLPTQYSLVCYAKEDLNITSGVPDGKNISAVIGKLLAQNQKEGGLAVVRDQNNFLYCLILSKASSSPTSESVFAAIQKLREHAVKNRVKKLVIPVMENWGKTDVTWPEVKSMFGYLLGPKQIEMIVVPLEPAYSMSSLQKRNKNKLSQLKSGIHQMKRKSVIIYLASADGRFTVEMESLAKKFDFGESFTKKQKVVTDVIKHKENEEYVLYGCVVRRSWNDEVDFEALQKCFLEVNRQNRTEKLQNIGMQAVKDQEGNVSYKIIILLLNCFQEVHIHVCWPGDLKSLMPVYT